MSDAANDLLDNLSPADREALLRHAVPVHLELGTDIVQSGELIQSVYFMLSGIVSAINQLTDGRSVEAFMVGREGVTGIEATTVSMRSESRQTVQLTGRALRVDASHVRAITTSHPGVRHALAYYQAAIQHELEQTASCHALHHAENRLAKWLLRCHDRADGDVIPLTQEYMAAMLGSQRTTINEAAQHLQAQRAVSYSRGMIRVLNRHALELAACECYRKLAPVQPAIAA